ncbi:Regulatory protein BlaR1 [Rubripirellula tenax]|uniref:Regulatory protein BlaR1 n=1 Tax=Rubripirellula tenax TaxID=2528015 RepID=A0A5C6EFP1_9BACT|nr:M56 family metallopeptidase [Rubripirellula tenax]TWU47598.1 Regulatory protein BlaR1 [Rubripirellula tenax]
MSDEASNIWTLFGEELAGRLLVTMLHFLWQAAVVAGLAWLMATALRTASPKGRYAMFCTAMAILPLLMVITFAVQDRPVHSPSITLTSDVNPDHVRATAIGITPDNSVRDQRTNIAIEDLANTVNTTVLGGFPLWVHDSAAWVVSAYLFGVSFFLVRLLIAVCGGSRLRARAEVIHDTGLCQQIADQARQLQLRRVPKVAYCQNVMVPTVVGLLRPMILLPTALTTGLTPDDLNAILRHEFAHIRRFDLWVNLGQRILESLLFFHPAVWWLSRRISAERELCCDDMVVSSGFLSIDYGGALLRMAERCAEANRARAIQLAADGQDRSLLEYRIQRLFNSNASSPFHLHRGGFAALLLVLMTLISIPCATIRFAQAQTPNASSPFAPASTAPGQDENIAFDYADTDPFGQPTQTKNETAVRDAFPPGVFGDQDHESTKKKVFQWIGQARSGNAAEREAIIEPLSQYLGVSNEIPKALMPLTYDSDKRVRTAASRVIFMKAGEIRGEPDAIKILRYRMVLTMVREDVHANLTMPFLVELMKTENANVRRAVTSLVVQMLRQGHNEVLDQIIGEKDDPNIVDRDEYYRAIEVFNNERSKIERFKLEAAKRQSSTVPGMTDGDPFGGNTGKTDPFGRPIYADKAGIEDPFGVPKPDTPKEAAKREANDAAIAFAVAEKRAIVAELSSPETRINFAFDDETSVHFVGTPLQEALQTIGKQHAIPIVLNRQALEESGLTPDVPVTISLANVSLRSAIRLMLRSLQLEMMIEDDVLQVTTREQMRSTSLSRKYYIGQLPYKGVDIARSLQRVLDATMVAGDAKPVVEYLSGGEGKEGIIWVQANEVAHREALGKLNWLLNK